MKIKAVLFDLDGTLLDTAPDLHEALNELLAQYNRPSVDFETTRELAGQGGRGFIKRFFQQEDTEQNFEQLRQEYFQLYQQRLNRATRVFTGMAEVLEYINHTQRLWGIVTNKPAFLTEPLLKSQQFPSAPSCVVSGDTLAKAKPHPEPVLFACEQVACDPSHCLFVGDNEVDVLAGRAAGVKTIVAKYGYIASTQDPQQWGADGYIDTPNQLLQWLDLPS